MKTRITTSETRPMTMAVQAPLRRVCRSPGSGSSVPAASVGVVSLIDSCSSNEVYLMAPPSSGLICPDALLPGAHKAAAHRRHALGPRVLVESYQLAPPASCGPDLMPESISGARCAQHGTGAPRPLRDRPLASRDPGSLDRRGGGGAQAACRTGHGLVRAQRGALRRFCRGRGCPASNPLRPAAENRGFH